MDRKQLDEIKRQGKLSARAVKQETIDTFVKINEVMAQLEFDRDRLSIGGKDQLDRYWRVRNSFVANRGGEVKRFLISGERYEAKQ